MLLFFVGVLIVKDMRTTREQREANTVHADKFQANLKPWSRPSRVAMSCCLGISYASGTGRVPV
jgi:hypothetical protein